jgi:hypothetical protein
MRRRCQSARSSRRADQAVSAGRGAHLSCMPGQSACIGQCRHVVSLSACSDLRYRSSPQPFRQIRSLAALACLVINVVTI